MKHRELFHVAVDVDIFQILIIHDTLQLQQISLGIPLIRVLGQNDGGLKECVL
jgi:hypothetical protein